MIKKCMPASFIGVDVARRTRKNKFLQKIDTLINWAVFAKELYKVYKRSIQDTTGRLAYNLLVLFKMALLQTWYNLSDYGVEKQVNDSPSCMRFCGLQLEYQVPDHSVVGRFRKALNQSGGWDVLLEPINSQCTGHGVFVKQGAIVDGFVMLTPRKSKERDSYRSHLQ